MFPQSRLLNHSLDPPPSLGTKRHKSAKWPAHIPSSQSEREIFLTKRQRFRVCLATVGKAVKCVTVSRHKLNPKERSQSNDNDDSSAVHDKAD